MVGYGVKAKLPQSLESKSNTIKGVKQTLDTDMNIIKQNYKIPLAVPYKIEVVKLETINCITWTICSIIMGISYFVF